MELLRGRKGKEKDKEPTILKYIIYVQLEDTIICVEINTMH
jgi:hypothetical protein